MVTNRPYYKEETPTEVKEKEEKLNDEELLSALADVCVADPSITPEFELAQNRKFFLNEEKIGEQIFDIQRRILLWNMEDGETPKEERKPIILYIMTHGGSVDLMWSLIDAIELSVTPVYTVKMGFAETAGGMIFLAGHKRFMMPRATVLIHEGYASIEGDMTKVQDWYGSCQNMLKASHKYILERTRITPRMLAKKKANDWTIDAQHCLEYGVCDEIVTSLDQII